jgi:hypothetical protein
VANLMSLGKKSNYLAQLFHLSSVGSVPSSVLLSLTRIGQAGGPKLPRAVFAWMCQLR